MRTWTKDEIRVNLERSNMWVVRGLQAIYQYQTDSEQLGQRTDESNGVGFNKMDAEILSSFAEFYKARGFLSPKQTAVARKRMLKYSGQLVRIANAKEEAKEREIGRQAAMNVVEQKLAAAVDEAVADCLTEDELVAKVEDELRAEGRM